MAEQRKQEGTESQPGRTGGGTERQGTTNPGGGTPGRAGETGGTQDRETGRGIDENRK